MGEKTFYRDLMTNKVHYTRAKFTGWTQPTGPLGVPYAIFPRGSDTLFIPRYALTPESRAALPIPEKLGEAEQGE